MIDPEFVRRAYLGLLNREPESQEVVDFWIGAGLSGEELLREMVRTPEFQSRQPGEPIEAYFYSEPQPIEVHIPREKLQALFDRTQAQWVALGETEPFWSVLTHDEYLSRNLDEQTREVFFDTGAQHARLIDLCAERAGIEVPSSGVCLELGCGVGRVTKHLAKRFDRVIALDISPGNLRIARAMAEGEGLKNIDFQLITSVADFDRLPPLDFFYSFIVLQHNPPPVQFKILDSILGKLRPGGGFLFQTQTYREGYKFIVDDYLKSSVDKMDMHSLPMREILRLIDRRNGLLDEVREDFWTGANGSHTFFGRARGEASGSTRAGSLMAEDRFEWERDLAADLDRVRERLANLSLALALAQSDAAGPPEPRRYPEILSPPPSPPPVRRAVWRRLMTYFKSVLQLSGTRHRTVILAADLQHLRVTTEAELSALTERVRADLTAIGALVQDQYQLVDAVRREVRTDSEQALAAGLQWRRDAEGEAGRQRALIGQRLDQLAAQLREARVASLESPRASGKAAKTARGPADADAAAADRIADAFQALLEARHRGDRDAVVQRLRVYLPDLEAAAARTGFKGPFIDLACGRGEFLELMTQAGLQAQGVDTRAGQLQDAMDRGLDAIRADALAHLRGLPDESVTGVTAIRLVEQLTFPQLALLMHEIRRVLRPGGLALFETPDPRNLIVGATAFHPDPALIKPPPEAMQALLETVGLEPVEVRPLHPSPVRQQMVLEGLNAQIADLLFGAQDYAVLGLRA